MARSSTVRYTYEDYLSTPEDPARRFEIVGGALFVTAAPRLRHQQVVTSLVRILSSLALDHRLGEVFTGPTVASGARPTWWWRFSPPPTAPTTAT